MSNQTAQARMVSSDPAAKAEFETLLRKEFESRWPKPKGVTWGAGINDYCVSEFAEGIALSYPDMWMAYKAGAMRTNHEIRSRVSAQSSSAEKQAY